MQAGFYAEIEEYHTREKLNIHRKIVIVQPGQTKTATGRILSGGCALVLSIFVKVPNQGDMCSEQSAGCICMEGAVRTEAAASDAKAVS